MLFPSICSSALAEGITLCLRSAYCLESVIWGGVCSRLHQCKIRCTVKNQFCAWFQSCWHRMVFFVWRPAKVRTCFPFWGASLTAGHHLSCPHSSRIQLREALPEVIQASVTELLDSWRGLHTIQQHLACCCHFHCPCFLCCLKKIISLQVYQTGLKHLL